MKAFRNPVQPCVSSNRSLRCRRCSIRRIISRSSQAEGGKGRIASEIGTCHSYILFRYVPFEFHALYSLQY